MKLLADLGGLIAVPLFTLGPVLGLMLLLNDRDRRQKRLLNKVWQIIPKDLSDRVGIQIRCGLILRRSLVTVEMQDCSREEIWEAIARWPAHLPPKVRLLVNGAVDRRLSARFTVETTRRPLPCSPHRPSPVAG